jgi:hypothetical protein
VLGFAFDLLTCCIRQMTLLFDAEQEVRRARLKAAVAVGADECGF